jgi:3-phenylpropionate/trans-cinnamate dioxygenase ferredoxin reductase subunit
VLGPEVGGKFADLHRAHGVEFRFNEAAAEFLAAGPGSGQVGSVVTTGGAELPADVVVIGIGAVPNDGLAKSAGLDVSNGVVCDSALRTSAPDVFAAGDVASSYLPLLGRHVRVDHWSNALNGGKAAATSMLGQQIEYNRVPYFFSDQYDLGMECAGLPSLGTYDQVVYRGDADAPACPTPQSPSKRSNPPRPGVGRHPTIAPFTGTALARKLFLPWNINS